MEKLAFIVCWRSGQAQTVDHVPKGALCLARGDRGELDHILGVVARHSYDGKTMLVPGVPEALSDEEALSAAEHFRGMIFERMSNPWGGLPR